MKRVAYPIIPVIVFLTMQAIAGAVILLTDGEAEGFRNEQGITNSSIFLGSILVSGIATVGIIAMLKMIEWREVLNIQAIRWKTGWLAVIAALLGIYSLNIAAEMLALPDLMENTFINMASTPLGWLTIGIAGPIVEEFVFRESVLGYMLRHQVKPWTAIILSAFIFGIIHLNPAQIPFAIGIGLVLGVIYYKTGNIVLTSTIHIVNNSAAVWQMYVMGTEMKEFSLIETMGGIIVSSTIMAASMTGCIWLLFYFWKNYKTKINYETIY